MTHVRRFDHVGINVIDLDAAVDFFLILGLEIQGKAHMEGEFVESIIALDNVNDDLVMMRTPDGSASIELVQFHSPLDPRGPQAAPANQLGIRHLSFLVDDVTGLVDTLREKGYHKVGQMRTFQDTYRLCYLRGPEGILVELAEELSTVS